MLQEPSNTVLHTSTSVMTEQANAVVTKRGLQTLIETLADQGIKCHIKVHKKDNMISTQYYARIGDALVPIGHASTRSISVPTPLVEYSLNYYLMDAPEEYLYTIMAYCVSDAIEAATAYLKQRSATHAMLTDSEDNFIWEMQ